jgi:hypothetical protein
LQWARDAPGNGLSELGFGQAHDQAFQFVRDMHLAAQAGAGLIAVEREFQQLIFHFRGRIDAIEPGWFNEAEAGSAGEGAAALRDDAVDPIVYGALHYGFAIGDINSFFGAVVLNVGYSSHGLLLRDLTVF